MEIYLVQNAGFCFGVERALRIAYETAKNTRAPIYTFGPLIHNPQVVEQLQKEGITPIKTLNNIEGGILIIRSHGLPPSLIEYAREKGFTIVDATCPFVKQAQEKAKMLKEKGYQVIILGEREHPEVQGILGFAGKNAICISNHNNIRNLPLSNRIGVVAQTTQSVEILSSVVSELIKISQEVRVFNTICTSTQQRQEATLQLTKEVDCMIVVGGKNSANTKRLATLVKERGTSAYHIETEKGLKKNWFSGVGKIGVTGGASTPDWMIQRVIDKIKKLTEVGLVCRGTEIKEHPI